MIDAALKLPVRLDGLTASLIIDLAHGVPTIVYWGPKLAEEADLATLAMLGAREEAPGSPAIEAPVALTPLAAQGFPGRPGLSSHRGGIDWAPYPTIVAVDPSPGKLTIESRCDAGGIALTHRLAMDPGGDMLVASSAIRNVGDGVLDLAALAAPVVPLPGFITRLIGFEGRWAGEFQLHEMARPPGLWTRENRRGRTSHDSFPAIIATEPNTTEQRGRAYGFHFGWSGNHRIGVETLADGRAHVAMEALLLPGEIRLAPGESYRTPDLFASVTDHGLSALSRAFHDHLRSRPEHARLRIKPRPVHYNSWEAIYFDHEPTTLMTLADAAAAVGAERFVLDDGWFLGRRNDSAGLGDWRVDPAIYPHGIAPLIDHVKGLGMEFGLWLEPEMVNPDSDLYRAHPDWALATPPAPVMPFRHQLVLDFGRPDVRDHLFDAVDTLLREHDIAYLKWDMNRDLSQPGGSDGRAAANAHVLGLYDVLDRLRAAHPAVEIESCASGGGRTDYGVLARTDRIWTSDSNDALDRLAIQRGASHFLPGELLGAHVGPATCHITGRRLSMALRVQTAMFGHMGMELDLRALDDTETAELAAGIALHKAHRSLIHTGDLVRLDTAGGVIAFGVVAADRSEALLSYTCITEQRASFPAPLRLAGLDPAVDYWVELVWPGAIPARSALVRAFQAAMIVSGEMLMNVGLQPPRLHPETGFVLHLRRA
ncbi:alpha-galactosidase [Sphingomonas koreensis]|nr:alpha-galactosidase [Sphingomonas koreensis]